MGWCNKCPKVITVTELQSVCSIQTLQVCFYLQTLILKMASGNLLDRLVWQFRHLWRDGNKARLSIESDHDGNAYASLHVDLGQGRRRPRQDPPPLPTHPPKSRHSQTQPINISKELNQSTQVVMTGKGFTPCESVGTQASDTVEVATDTVEDTIISVENNESNEPVETLAEVVIHNSDNSSQPTITVSGGEIGNEGMKGVVSEVTEDDLDEEEEAEFEDATDDLHDESLGLPPHEEGANITFPATPLGKKVVTEGREEGPDEGEPWRLANSRRRRRSSTDEARHAKLCALAQKLNHYFFRETREGHVVGVKYNPKWLTDGQTGKLLTPRLEALESWMITNEVAEKDADSLTSEWRKFGVDCALEPLMDSSKWGWYRRRLQF